MSDFSVWSYLTLKEIFELSLISHRGNSTKKITNDTDQNHFFAAYNQSRWLMYRVPGFIYIRRVRVRILLGEKDFQI